MPLDLANRVTLDSSAPINASTIGEPQRRVSRVMFFAGVILCLCFAYNMQAFWNATIDDAYITARYSQNFADGYGLTFSRGMLPVEGYSDPLWMLLLAGVCRIFGPSLIIPAAKVVSLACLVAICFLFLSTRKRSRSQHNNLALGLAICSCLALPGISLWSTAGLETVPYSLAIFAALIWSSTKSDLQRYFPGSALAIGCACLLRPEAGMFLLAPICSRVFFGWRENRPKLLLRVLADCAVFALFAGSLLLFRIHYYHALVPNTFLVKAGGSVHQVSKGLHYLLHYLEDPLLLALFSLAAYGCAKGWRNSPYIFCSGIMISLQLFFVLWSGGDWMPLYRFLIPLIPALLLPVSLALADLNNRVVSKYAFAALCTLLLLVLSAHAAYDFAVSRSYARRLSEGLNTRIALGMWMHEHVESSKTVAYGDVGALPFFSRLKWIDFNGLVTREVALILYRYRKHPGEAGDFGDAGEAIDEYVLSQHPDFLILVTQSPVHTSQPTDYGAHIEERPAFHEQYGYVGTLTAYGPGMVPSYPSGRYLQLFSSKASPASMPLKNEIDCLNSVFAADRSLAHLVSTCAATS